MLMIQAARDTSARAAPQAAAVGLAQTSPYGRSQKMNMRAGSQKKNLMVVLKK